MKITNKYYSPFKKAITLVNSRAHSHFNGVRTLRIRLTNKCNAKCVFCHGENGSTNAPYLFLPLMKISKTLNLLDHKISSIALSGGEPLLHPKIIEITKLCVEKAGKNVHINTNALLFKKGYIEGIVNAGVHDFHINLNTLCSNIYKKEYGVNFPTNLSGKLEKLQDLGVKITINFVYTIDKNKQDVINMIEFCKQNNCSLTIIEEYCQTPPFSGLMFQARMYKLLNSINFVLESISPGRVVYSNSYRTISVAAPCAPALAWNGDIKDNAMVLHENGNLTGFIQ